MTIDPSDAVDARQGVETDNANAQAVRGREPAPVTVRRRIRRRFYHCVARLFMFMHSMALAVATRLGRRPRSPLNGTGYEILLTGRFFSENWALSLLRPLAASEGCWRLVVVSACPLPQTPKVKTVCPARWLIRLVGDTPARLLVFAWTAIRRRPHILGGFHIAVNGLLAAVLAPLVGARSLYLCVGGPTEILDGGLGHETNIFHNMETPDPVVERRLLQAVNACDLVITMGSRAAEFLRAKGIGTSIHVIAGGIDGQLFRPSNGLLPTGLILVGRLVEIKRVDLFLRVVAAVAKEVPGVEAVVVGKGPLRGDLEQQAKALGIDHCVKIIGFHPDIAEALAQAKVFVLTSRSEGLSLALIEAMMCGLPAVVSNVGDLGDLVEDGVNGYLVDGGAPEPFAARIVDLLSDGPKYAAFSKAARSSALRYEIGSATRKWDVVFAELSDAGARGAHE